VAGLPLPDDAANPALAAQYAAARAREGKVMAILRSLGPRADLVEAFVSLVEATFGAEGALTVRERELLAVAASEANGADYSTAVHSELLAREGGARDTPRDAAMIAFARRLTLIPREGAEATAALRELLSDDEVYDAIAVVGLLNLANRAALATGITVGDDL